jgi:membrane protease YdiL (CAAX protease family)
VASAWVQDGCCCSFPVSSFFAPCYDANPDALELIRKNRYRIRDALLALAGILLFAGFIHRDFPLLIIAVAGIAGAGIAIGYSIRNISFTLALGIDKLNRRILQYCLPAVLLGIILGVLARHRFDLPLVPEGLSMVALVAPLVGVVEELIFRGYMQGLVRPLGRSFSIVFAASAHTGYKVLVILSLSGPFHFDYAFLVCWTITGGLLFGILRELSGSTFPPLFAHAVFDILLYGGMASAPVWVWS